MKIEAVGLVFAFREYLHRHQSAFSMTAKEKYFDFSKRS
jgi:hypothetical protein